MKLSRKLSILLCLALPVLAVIGVILKKPRVLSLSLPDGLVLSIGHVAYTNVHSWTPRGPFATFLSRWLPARLDAWLGLPNPGTSFSSDTASLGIWFSVSDPSRGGPVRPAESVDLEFVDSDGCVFRASGKSPSQTWTRGTGQIQVALSEFTNFPRDQAVLTLRVVDRQGRPLGNLALQNPQPPPAASTWNAEDLPLIRQTNGLAVSLREIKVVPHEISQWDRAPFHFEPKFAVTYQGKPAPEWYLDGHVLRGASGNIGHWLCPNEPAWKIEARFIKEPTATFEKNQVWDLGVLSVPGPGTVQSLNLQNRFDPAILQVFAFCGAGHYQWSNDVCVIREPVESLNGMSVSGSTVNGDRFVELKIGRPHLLLKSIGLGHQRRLSARATTDRGEVVGRRFAHQSGESSLFDFELPPGTRTLHLELILQDPVPFEFTVHPPKVPPAKPADLAGNGEKSRGS